jgi:hypothetical protein
MKNLIKSNKLESLLLEEIYRAWQERPGPKDFFLIQQLWDNVYKNYGKKIDGPLAEGVFNSLLELKFIEAIKTDDESIAGHITKLGRDALEKVKDNHRTKMIAIVGAICGILSLIFTLIKMIISQ